MNQRQLFDDLPARGSDPMTSKLAAEQLEASGQLTQQQLLVANLVLRYPGLTARELARRYPVSHEIVHKRMAECERRGKVRRGEPRRCQVTGRMAITWWPHR